MLNINQIVFIAEECARQKSGERSVANMCKAWDWAQAYDPQDLIENFEHFVKTLARFVEPGLNAFGYRQTPVTFSSGASLSAVYIPREMLVLGEACGRMSSQELYVEFQKVHPFRDGNGRTGKILFNLRAGFMNEPIFPKEPSFPLRIA